MFGIENKCVAIIIHLQETHKEFHYIMIHMEKSVTLHFNDIMIFQV